MIIQHLRGTRGNWEDNDLVIPDGELALLRENGRTRIKIGDGSTPFSKLPFTDGAIKQLSGGGHVFLCTGDDVRLGACAQLMLNLPDVIDEDFYATVTFDSPSNTATVFGTSHSIVMTGDNTDAGCFIPVPGCHYTVLVWYDGTMQGLVRGADTYA